MSSRRETTESERLLVVKWSKEGKSLREITSLIGVTHGCVQKILQKYKKTGSVASIPGRGRKEILSTTVKRKIIHSVKKDPRMSASKLALSMASIIGEKISDETIRRTLHQYGFHGRTPIRKPLIKAVGPSLMKESLLSCRTHVGKANFGYLRRKVASKVVNRCLSKELSRVIGRR
ncbi:uncharacterized protein TNCT_634401 [Trichonephila clavata]|uniref:Transposase Tc1-like domain-containing protein n=1 Tax=Trichonephila clavata TaxID=2740835 RepID=A0A8X6F0S9_TRICU|nr:uncharacterized protein TNCT_634401 [Trichonephila clavata]